jgi:Predicted AAA-ATPase
MINIFYGESDFHKLMVEDYFYQDRTQFIEKLENWKSNYPVFLRPRRFGKSLFMSVLHHYYGIEHKEAFDILFGKWYIGQNPTKRANSYLVLRFDFSGINTKTNESTYKGFLKNVLYGARLFLSNYNTLFNDADKQLVLSQESPEAVLQTIFGLKQQNKIKHKIYVMIDEYDHFANELLSFDLKRFLSDVTGDGFVRKFYECLKESTGQGITDKIFITGVSPITMDSLTSGFNIGDNITLNPIFHDMMGFTHAEVTSILEQVEIPIEKRPAIMSDLIDWFDGYVFSDDDNQPLFNPNMVLYFLKEYSIKNKYPKEILDSNIMTDYRKLRNIFKIGGDETDKFELLDELVKKGSIDFTLTRIFNIVHNFTDEDFLSLLFYMGMLTFKEARSSDWRFEIPNYVIKKLVFS